MSQEPITVGEMIEQLQKLDRSMPIIRDSGGDGGGTDSVSGVKVVSVELYRYGKGNGGSYYGEHGDPNEHAQKGEGLIVSAAMIE